MHEIDKKRSVAQAALHFVEDDSVVGIGTGSTIDCFIQELVAMRSRIEGAVVSSVRSEEGLRQHRIPIIPLNSCDSIAVYVDSADECTRHRHLIKGGGGALTREKIIAAASHRFVCIVDDSKLSDVLGAFPLAVEVIPFARSYVAREISKLGGQPVYRQGFVTDNGNEILDVHNIKLLDPVQMERRLNNIAGVVCNGIFAVHPPDIVLMASARGIEKF